jgi:hypothetical protein
MGRDGNVVGMISTHWRTRINFLKRTFGCSIFWRESQPWPYSILQEEKKI